MVVEVQVLFWAPKKQETRFGGFFVPARPVTSGEIPLPKAAIMAPPKPLTPADIPGSSSEPVGC